MIASHARIANSFITRLVGLLKTPSLAAGEGLYIAPCTQIHMFGMKYAIDVVFMDKQGQVVGLCQKIEPGQISPLFSRAFSCIEIPPGTISATRTETGDLVTTGPAAEAPKISS